MENITVSAKTYDEAITKALIALSTTSDHLVVEVVEKGSAGLFGVIGSRPWTIRAHVKSEEEEAKEAAEKAAAEKAEQERIAAERKAAAKAEEERKAAERKAAEEKNAAERKAAEEKKAAERKAAAEKKAAEEKKAAGQASSEKPEASEQPAAEKKPERKPAAERRPSDRRRNETDRKDRPQRGDRQERPVSRRREEPVGREVPEAEANEIRQKAISFLQELFRVMDEEIEIDTDFNYQDNELSVLLSGDDMGVFIGKRGQTLDSLQYLVSLVVNKHRDVYIRVKLDTENYRERREQKLKSLARNIAHKVKRTRKSVALEPMNPYERRIIHSALQRDPYVTTYSEGEDPYRHIVVAPKKDSRERRRYGRNQRPYGAAETAEVTETAEILTAEVTETVTEIREETEA